MNINNIDPAFEGAGKSGTHYRFEHPLKMPRGRAYGSDYYIMPSVKRGDNVEAFSNLEYANLIRLEMDPNVEYYCPQPCRCKVTDEDGKTRTVVFDTWVLYRDGHEELQEVKYSSELSGDSREALNAARQIECEAAFCVANNINFVVRTENEIKGKPSDVTVQNLEILASHVWHMSRPEDSNLQRKIMTELGKYSQCIIDDMYRLSPKGTGYVFDELAVMFYKGQVCMDIDNVLINRNTRIWR